MTRPRFDRNSYRKGAGVDDTTSLIGWVIFIQPPWNVVLWRIECACKEASFAITTTVIETGVRLLLCRERFIDIFEHRIIFE